MTRKQIFAGAALVSVITLSGCASAGNVGQALWDWDIRGNKDAGPSVARAAPLVVPPDFALEPAAVAVTRSTDTGQEQVLRDLVWWHSTPLCG